MRMSVGNIGERLSVMPMAVAVVPLAVGIAVSAAVCMPVWVWGAATALLSVAALLLRRCSRTFAAVALCAAIFALGATLYGARMAEETVFGHQVEVELKVLEPSRHGERSNRTRMRVAACGECTGMAGAELAVWSARTLSFDGGERLRAEIVIRPLAATEGSSDDGYLRRMARRGCIGSATLRAENIVSLAPARRSLHGAAVEKLQRLLPSGDARSVVLSIGTGERGEVGRTLARVYSASGTSHLLAVSGLHVGIVFMLVNMLLWFVPLVRHGNIWRSLLSLAAIWLYVVLCSSPPSAVRAAIMFSVLQLSLFSTGGYVSLNTLGATAFVMLLAEPALLFDAGFNLSFTAVAGILVWGAPLCGAVRSGFRPLDAMTATLLVGVSATLATMPMISHMFGIVPLVGMAVNPVVILLSNLILFAAVLSLVVPFDAVAGWFANAAARFADVQNLVVEGSASLPGGYLDIRIPEGAEWAAYLVFAAITLLVWSVSAKK